MEQFFSHWTKRFKIDFPPFSKVWNSLVTWTIIIGVLYLARISGQFIEKLSFNSYTGSWICMISSGKDSFNNINLRNRKKFLYMCVCVCLLLSTRVFNYNISLQTQLYPKTASDRLSLYSAFWELSFKGPYTVLKVMRDSFKGVFLLRSTTTYPWITEKPRWACLV